MSNITNSQCVLEQFCRVFIVRGQRQKRKYCVGLDSDSAGGKGRALDVEVRVPEGDSGNSRQQGVKLVVWF